MYVGEYKGLLRDGRGSYTFPGNCFHYSGEWHHGKMHGQGVGLKKWPDGSSYSGQFHRGEMHGEGVYLSAKGERYEGHWENNQRCGHGQLLLQNGDSYSGDFLAHKPHGRGKMVLAVVSSVYEGEWDTGMRSGNGLLCDSLGNRLYEGSWIDNLRHGDGFGALPIVNYTSEAGNQPSSLWYEGKWVNDQPEVCTTTLVVRTESSRLSSGSTSDTQDVLCDLPDQLFIENKQLPVLAVVCLHQFGGQMNESVQVQGEHGRRFRMRIFEGAVPQQSTDASETENNAADGPAGSAWHFISSAVNTASRTSLLRQRESEQASLPSSPQGAGASERSDAESGDAKVPTIESQVPSETLLDEVIVEAHGGLAVFRNLSLPAATLIGDYYLVCESMTSDSLPPVFIALSVK